MKYIHLCNLKTKGDSMKKFALIAALFTVQLLAADAIMLNNWKISGPIPYLAEADKELVDFDGDKFIRQATSAVAGFEAVDFYTETSGRLFFHEMWKGEEMDNMAAFAAAELELAADQAGIYEFFVAFDTDIEVWINNIRVFEQEGSGEKMFFARLNAGNNRIVLKNIHHTHFWAIRFHISEGPLSDAEAKATMALMAKRAEYVKFSENFLTNDNYNIITTGELPKLTWSDPESAAAILGSAKVKVTWYDNDGNQIDSIDKERALYWAFVETTLPNGAPYRRLLAFYTAPEDWFDAPEIAEFKEWIAKDRAWIAYAVASVLGDAPENHPEMPPFALELRKKFYPNAELVTLAPPKMRDEPATTLVYGTEEEANVKPGTAAKLDELWQATFDTTGIPFHTMAARNGVIFFAKGYGEIDGEPQTEKTVGSLASISKLITGILFIRFVDQDLMGIDENVSRYLPVFANYPDKLVTPRIAFTHLNDIQGHYNFGSVGNVFADDLQSWLTQVSRPGRAHAYNGAGYNLMGLLMMAATGRTLPDLYAESYYKPLEITTISGDDQGGGYRASSMDLAKLAQMMLNRGSYGDYEFFSPESWELMLPTDVGKYVPTLNGTLYHGLGLVPMGWREDGKDHFIGHGAATMAHLMFNLEDQTLFVQQRNEKHAWELYETNLNEVTRILVEACRD